MTHSTCDTVCFADELVHHGSERKSPSYRSGEKSLRHAKREVSYEEADAKRKTED